MGYSSTDPKCLRKFIAFISNSCASLPGYCAENIDSREPEGLEGIKASES